MRWHSVYRPTALASLGLDCHRNATTQTWFCSAPLQSMKSKVGLAKAKAAACGLTSISTAVASSPAPNMWGGSRTHFGFFSHRRTVCASGKGAACRHAFFGMLTCDFWHVRKKTHVNMRPNKNIHVRHSNTHVDIFTCRELFACCNYFNMLQVFGGPRASPAYGLRISTLRSERHTPAQQHTGECMATCTRNFNMPCQ